MSSIADHLRKVLQHFFKKIQEANAEKVINLSGKGNNANGGEAKTIMRERYDDNMVEIIKLMRERL